MVVPMKIRIPATAKAVLDGLHAKGFEAYIVGGCVRDSVLGKKPSDWDITTNAWPEQVKAIFPRTVDTGIKHGTVTVLIGSGQHEVTTYRVDGTYSDGRHPDNVTFTRSLDEDLKRRDFTVNAMAYSEETGLIDRFGGMQDLQRGIIRCVGDPMERFQEDALRILRAVRFAAQLNFSIDRPTAEAIEKLAPTLSKISAERICTELVKLICSDYPEYLNIAYEAGITAVIFPEFDAMMKTPQNNPHHMYNVGVHTMASMKNIKSDRTLRLTMMLHDVAKPLCRTTDDEGIDHFRGHAEKGAEMAVHILRRLKLDNDTIRTVKTLVKYHDYRIPPEEKPVRKLISRVGPERFHDLILVRRADTLAQSEYFRDEKLQNIDMVAKTGERILRERQAVTLKDLAVDGNDLIRAGIPAGPVIGKILGEALNDVLDDQSLNTREHIMQIAEKYRLEG